MGLVLVSFDGEAVGEAGRASVVLFSVGLVSGEEEEVLVGIGSGSNLAGDTTVEFASAVLVSVIVGLAAGEASVVVVGVTIGEVGSTTEVVLARNCSNSVLPDVVVVVAVAVEASMTGFTLM